MEEEKSRIYGAVWASHTTGLLSLREDWKAPKPPQIHWGSDRLPVRGVRPAPPMHFGRISGYYAEAGDIHFVLPLSEVAHLDLEEENGVYLVGDFNGWENAAGKKKWLLREADDSLEEALRESPPVSSPDDRSAENGESAPPEDGDDGGDTDGGDTPERRYLTITVPLKTAKRWKTRQFKFITGKRRWISVPYDAPNAVFDEEGNRNYAFDPKRTGHHEFLFETPLPFNIASDKFLVVAIDGDEETAQMRPGPFLKELRTERRLGAVCTETETTFRLFAPLAHGVDLHLYEDAEGDPGKPIAMHLRDNVVWEATVPGNRHGWLYHYQLQGYAVEAFIRFDPNFRVLDPHAKTLVGPAGPGIVVDESKLPRPETPFTPPPWHELVVMEGHVRDLAAHAPAEMPEEERTGFRGLARWVRESGGYLRSLGVNAVELQPVQAFDSADFGEYAWGYMPINYFSPAPQYCSTGAGLDVFAEFADLVAAFHEAGIAVLLDVVYNHTGEPNHFQYIDRNYYFLLDQHGNYLNHSGCGNTFDCGTPMVRRLIVESLLFLIERFDVDGFRFDLGELLGRDTLVEIEKAVKAVKPSTIVIAEPWSFRGHIIGQLKETGIASWNDGYREFMKDYVGGEGGAEGLFYFMTGSRDVFRFPAQTVNYVESHDDRCWIDEITEHENGSGENPTALDRRRTHLMAAILFMSVGIPMLHQGVDMLKSKGGKQNTYQDGETNALHYGRLREFPATHDYFRAWIRFRLGAGRRLLCLHDGPDDAYFSSTSTENALALLLNADQSVGEERLLFAVNPAFHAVSLPLPEPEVRPRRQIADAERFAPDGLSSATVPVNGDGHIELPPLSCALWWA